MGADDLLNNERTFSVLGKDVLDDKLRGADIVGGRPGGGVPAMFAGQSAPVEEAPGYYSSFDAGSTTCTGIFKDKIMETKLTAERAGAEDAADITDTVETANAVPATTVDTPRAVPTAACGTEAEASKGEGAPRCQVSGSH